MSLEVSYPISSWNPTCHKDRYYSSVSTSSCPCQFKMRCGMFLKVNPGGVVRKNVFYLHPTSAILMAQWSLSAPIHWTHLHLANSCLPYPGKNPEMNFSPFHPNLLTISLTFLLKIALLKSHCSHFTQIFSLAQNVLLVHLMSKKVREEPRTTANQQTWESRWALTRSSGGQTNNKKTCVS